MASVRRATAADLDQLVEMARDLHAEAPNYQAEPFEADVLRRRLADRVATGMLVDHNAVFIAEVGGRAVGVLLAIIVPREFNNRLIACETSLYVRPECRGGRVFPQLVAAFKAWGRAEGAVKAFLGVSTGIHADRTVCAYERLGFKLVGHNLSTDL